MWWESATAPNRNRNFVGVNSLYTVTCRFPHSRHFANGSRNHLKKPPAKTWFRTWAVWRSSKSYNTNARFLSRLNTFVVLFGVKCTRYLVTHDSLNLCTWRRLVRPPYGIRDTWNCTFERMNGNRISPFICLLAHWTNHEPSHHPEHPCQSSQEFSEI